MGELSQFSRRRFLRSSASVATALAVSRAVRADGRMPDVPAPRATSGDQRVEPAWDTRFEITAGPGGEIAGETDRVIQAAIDYIARMGGGTVRLRPGTYRLRNSVFLRTGVRLVGSGDDCVLVKLPSVSTVLAQDSDWYDQEITVADSAGLELGDGITIATKNPHHGGQDVLKRTLIARTGNRFKLDSAPRVNLWISEAPTVTSVFPCITAEFAHDMAVEDIVIDGNRDQNANLNGNYGGGLWFQDCHNLVFRGVTARNYNGDGFSFQICHDVVVESCRSLNNADLGIHPGSGSKRPRMRNNVVEGNTIGIFFCWGVQDGIAERNTLRGNRTSVSIGHRDHYNTVRDNEILDSGEVAVLFRPERGEGFTATGNNIENNRIVNSGGTNAAAIDIQGVTDGNTIVRNQLRETRGAAERTGIRLGPESGQNIVKDNTFEGFSAEVVDLRRA